MKKITFLFVSILLFGLSISQTVIAQSPDWTRVLQANTNSLPAMNTVTADANYVYMAGKISGPVDFDGVNYTNIGFDDLLIVKRENNGAALWIKQINAQSSGSIVPDVIEVDVNGNIFISATFTGTVTIGNSTITSGPMENAFCAAFDGSGNGMWATPFLKSGTGSSLIAFDSDHNVYLISKTSKFLKFTAMGALVFEQSYPDRTLQSIVVYGSDLFLGGTLQGGVTTFGTIDLNSMGGYNTGFMVKANLDGNYTNSIVVGGSDSGDGSSVSDIVIDNNGKLIITGSYTKGLILNNISIIKSQSYYTYIAKCDNNFVFDWAQSSEEFPGMSQNGRTMWAYRIFLDDANNIYEYGIINYPFTFGNVTINLSTNNQFLIKFDSEGNAVNGYALSNSYYDRTYVTLSGKTIIGSTFNTSGDVEFGNFFLTQYSNTLDQEWQLLSSNSLSGIAKINYLKHDDSGNTYIQSRIIGHCDYFGTIINTNSYKTIISKHRADGTMMWMNQIADVSPYLNGASFTLDNSNNIITVGLFQTMLVIGDTVLYSTNYDHEGYAAKYSTDGQFLWASKLDLSLQSVSTDITVATDNSENVVVSGRSGQSIYLVKYNTSGNKLWSKIYDLAAYYGALVSTDADNNIYITSEIHLSDIGGTAMIGEITFTQTYDDGATVLIKFDPSGNALWAKTYGGIPGNFYSDGFPCDIKTDAVGNSYLFGWFRDNASFGNTTLTIPFETNQHYSLFLAKINTSGDVLWANAIYGKKYSYNFGDLLDLDGNGNVYVGGHFKDSILIEEATYSPEGKMDFFLAKYSFEGSFQWIKTIPANSAIISALAIKKEDVLSIVGQTGINETLGDFDLVRTSGSNSMVATLGTLPLSVTENENTSLKFYPNPAKDYVIIETTVNQKGNIIITDMSGRIVLTKAVSAGEKDIMIHVNHLAKGFYTIALTDSNQRKTAKLNVY